MKQLISRSPFFNAAALSLAVMLPNFVSSAPNTADFVAAPPFVATNVGKPNVVIALDISGSMKAVAYRDVSAGGWSNATTVHDDFDPGGSYFGYFDSASRYRYDGSANKRFFVADETGDWDGNFLNWLTMRRMDVVRKVLVGGKVRDRDGEVIDGDTWYVIEGQNEPEDRTFRKRYSDSAAYSPFANDTEILIADGVVSANTIANSKVITLSDSVEIGQLSIDRNTDELEDLSQVSNWHVVEFENTYTNPVVVTTGLSYNGSDPTHARIRNVTATQFEIRLEEWEYRDINHTTEQVTYVVAENTGVGTPNEVLIDGTPYEVRAGINTTNTTTSGSPLNTTFQNVPSGSYTPVVFAGVSSQNDDRPVIVRVHNVGLAGFDLALQNEESYAGSNHPATEAVHWIAMEPFSGISDHSNVAAEVGDSGGAVVDNSFDTISFSGGTSIFTDVPILAVGAQSANGTDTAHPRYRNLGINTFQAMLEEEQSADSETGHVTEAIGYLAVESVSGYKIQVGVQDEPEGVVQENSASMRIGLAVYNYDHTRNPTSIYNGNTVHGGTFRACYPDVSKTVSARDNFDICYDTHVKSPLSNIINVIEDHPLIWGTTPIAETLYDIKGYFAQTNHNRNGHTQWYDNGKEGISGNSPFDGQPKARNSYEISNDWDPYYYDEFGTTLPCAKSFVLHFNDGAPYTDFDGDAAQHPAVPNDGVGSSGPQQVLDDLALVLRENDCRTEAGMDGHQEIVSYYVFAALGEDEANDENTRKMREAAANGGFIDADGDLEPDPPHPANFRTYISNGVCSANEWDSDADCNPDNFYFANDGEALVRELNAAFEDIVTRAATGGASSVIAASRSGEGSVVNAIFRPFVTSGAEEVKWIGDVHALMIDDAGHIRQDDGDATLEDASADPYLDMCTDEVENLVRAKLSTTTAARPTSAQFAACSESVFSLDLFDIQYLWSGANWLSSLSDAQATNQRSYTSTAGGRHIISGIDSDANGIVQNAEQVDFLAASFPEAYAGLLATDLTTAQDVITWIRGQDVAGYRSRQLDGRTMRLGDVVYSTPTIVGRPAENLHLLYESESYREFLVRYKNRRQVIYAGGNDGMVHAFNGGWYDSDTKRFLGAHGSAPGSTTNYALGAELWAYVPYNALPHLDYLMRPSYGTVTSDHVYFVDLKPRIFDAKIFADDTDHPGGWGTVLVIGMRLGGGATTVDINLDGATTDNRTLTSSVAIFDITNPDNPPRLLLEFTHPDLGFTTALPAPVTVGTNNEGDGDWYLMLGSGADTTTTGFDMVASTQNAKLFLIDLKDAVAGNSTVLESGFGTGGIVTLGDSNSFISDLTAVDFGLDNFTTDALYFGTVSGNIYTGWGGKIYRLMMQQNTGAAQEALADWTPQEVLDAGAPVTAPVAVAGDSLLNRWLFIGTGRYFTSLDNLDNSANTYFGLKEPRNTSGAFTYGAVNAAGIADISSVQVQVDTGILDPAPSLSPGLAANATVNDLELRMKQYANATNYVAGWRRNLAAGERNFGGATVLGGTLTYTTFDPIFDECSIDGDSYLYAVNALTGTAAARAVLPQDSAATHNAFVVDIGSSPATSPSLHRGTGYTTNNRTTAIVQAANGNIITVEQDNQDSVNDGEASWRQLR